MAMRPIDRFVSALHRENADELVLESGKTGRVRLGSHEKVVLAQEVRTDQIELLLRDVLSDELERTLRTQGDVSALYAAPTGQVMIRVRRSGERIGVSIRPHVTTPPRGRVVVERYASHPPSPGPTGTYGTGEDRTRRSGPSSSPSVPIAVGTPVDPPPAAAQSPPSSDGDPIVLEIPTTGNIPELPEGAIVEEAGETALDDGAETELEIMRTPRSAPRGAAHATAPAIGLEHEMRTLPPEAEIQSGVDDRAFIEAYTSYGAVPSAPMNGGRARPDDDDDGGFLSNEPPDLDLGVAGVDGVLGGVDGGFGAGGRVPGAGGARGGLEGVHPGGGIELEEVHPDGGIELEEVHPDGGIELEEVHPDGDIELEEGAQIERGAVPATLSGLVAIDGALDLGAPLIAGDTTPSAPPRFPPELDRGPAPIVQRPGSVPPVKHKVDAILFALLDSGGSDLHLTSGLEPRMRKDGEIGRVPGFEQALSSPTIESWLMEIAPVKSRQRFDALGDADYGYEIPGIARLRVNAFRDRRGVGGVFRSIPAEIRSAEALALPAPIRDLCALESGLVILAGPTGSGTSTTAASMIDLINRTRADHVITVEDPVEFVHEPKKCLINQREIRSDTESFLTGLRAALREDPDIIFVGQLDDPETISLALETAETGHLVLTISHTSTVVSAIERIIDQFPTDRQAQARVLLSSVLRGVVAQTLCKKIGGGRVAALEILVVLPAISNLIREAKTFQIPSVMQTAKSTGMQTLNDALFALVQSGQIEPEEALRRAVARSDLRVMLDVAGYRAK